MVKFFKLCLFVICSFLKLVKDQKYCGIDVTNYNVKSPSKKQEKSVDDNYRPIKIHVDSTSLQDGLSRSKFNFLVFETIESEKYIIPTIGLFVSSSIYFISEEK